MKQFSVQAAPPIRVNIPAYIDIEDVYPDRDWNPNVRIMRTNRASFHGVLGAFRYRIGKQRVDVFVGISSNLQSQQSARYWCVQEPCKERAIPLAVRYLGRGGPPVQPHDSDPPQRSYRAELLSRPDGCCVHGAIARQILTLARDPRPPRAASRPQAGAAYQDSRSREDRRAGHDAFQQIAVRQRSYCELDPTLSNAR
jgi:hypothetical protein